MEWYYWLIGIFLFIVGNFLFWIKYIRQEKSSKKLTNADSILCAIGFLGMIAGGIMLCVASFKELGVYGNISWLIFIFICLAEYIIYRFYVKSVLENKNYVAHDTYFDKIEKQKEDKIDEERCKEIERKAAEKRAKIISRFCLENSILESSVEFKEILREINQRSIDVSCGDTSSFEYDNYHDFFDYPQKHDYDDIENKDISIGVRLLNYLKNKEEIMNFIRKINSKYNSKMLDVELFNIKVEKLIRSKITTYPVKYSEIKKLVEDEDIEEICSDFTNQYKLDIFIPFVNENSFIEYNNKHIKSFQICCLTHRKEDEIFFGEDSVKICLNGRKKIQMLIKKIKENQSFCNFHISFSDNSPLSLDFNTETVFFDSYDFWCASNNPIEIFVVLLDKDGKVVTHV